MSKKTPYWLDYLQHPAHLMAVGVGCVAALVASLPWGGDGFGLTLLAMAALETVAIAVIPGLPRFRQWADEQERNRTLNQMYARLQAEIEAHGGSDHLQNFLRMTDRVASLYRMAEDAHSTLTRFDVQQLEDTTIDFLRLCLSDAAMKEARHKGSDSESTIRNKLHEVQQAMQRPDLSQHEMVQLRRAESDFTEALRRHSRMASRRAMLDAALLSMPIRMDEVYQMVMTAPRSGNMGSLLEESLAKLRISEEVSMDLDQELGLPIPPYRSAAPVAAPQAPAATAPRKRATIQTRN
ncbi:hypothetical protein [Verminephrobacter aporrectodeae]|uniref:5-bromo-4-chloroindolyl phosphate hydrolysis protein n=1 Tax=Verminephrobacter aporrectodeae subsp. tuberculatae TaxID=1110392 RepID=A0ABT3KS17_9BURK|nr:hypothetical protein [Verminephrobacter aporrectodeae]MCW5321122.1 hypothetical protein [Verminephrobacter aporrectodeae subsp. tuberculatae]MCW8176039.1 hypothetical protein [Verminephrobacter aporrectodeae subsp. tuberculatae]MCW8200502.1 hypothetical protein [Verminephrobacter aporrectodeae subsp. tuberculatae]MCW8203682.1 hypothetical protein [Verminephrobacter aporrectodeae subsp. tuberculatae]MCW8208257.1 hypothetical protein [Verminephrobacter aporrectodeae subsp. tuberculatae]